MEPSWCLHVGDLVDHPDLPAGGGDGSVVEPAQDHSVVGVGGAAFGVGGDVVDFAPGGGDGAAGDEASAVAEGDGAALLGREAALFGAESDDGAAGVEGDGLGAAGADHLVDRPQREWDGVAAGAAEGHEPGTVPGFEVVGGDGDQDGGGSPTDGGGLAGSGEA